MRDIRYKKRSSISIEIYIKGILSDVKELQSQIIFFEFTFKLKININNLNLLVNFSLKASNIPEIFNVLSSENRATAIIDTSYL